MNCPWCKGTNIKEQEINKSDRQIDKNGEQFSILCLDCGLSFEPIICKWSIDIESIESNK